MSIKICQVCVSSTYIEGQGLEGVIVSCRWQFSVSFFVCAWNYFRLLESIGLIFRSGLRHLLGLLPSTPLLQLESTFSIHKDIGSSLTTHLAFITREGDEESGNSAQLSLRNVFSWGYSGKCRGLRVGFSFETGCVDSLLSLSSALSLGSLIRPSLSRMLCFLRLTLSSLLSWALSYRTLTTRSYNGCISNVN